MSSMPAGRSVREQIRLFPAAPPSPRAVDLHAISVPARAFTGDFYFTHRSGDRLWLVVGDVAGKGLHASVVMAMIQEELEHRITSCAASMCDPATTMQRLDAFLRPLLPSNRFATAVVAQLHDDGTLQIANAGHCPPLIARADGTVQEVGSTGPVAGILPSARWSTVSMKLGRGESLVLYTDGVVEAREGSSEFGIDGVKQVLATAHHGSASSIASAIRHALRAHQRDDDFTLFVAKR